MEIELKHEKYKIKDLWTGYKIQVEALNLKTKETKIATIIFWGCLLYLYFFARILCYFFLIIKIILMIYTLYNRFSLMFILHFRMKFQQVFLNEDEIIIKLNGYKKVLPLEDTKMFIEKNCLYFLKK